MLTFSIPATWMPMRPSRPLWRSSRARAFDPPGRKSPPAERRLRAAIANGRVVRASVFCQGSGSAGLNRLADGRQCRPGSMKEKYFMAKGSALRKPENDTSSSEFAALLDESLGGSTSFEGSVVKGTVIRIANDFVTIDVGLKSEGRVALREFANGTGAPEVKEGDVIDIFVDRMENKEGEAVLSRDKARREEAWTLLEKAFNDQERVMGTIFGRVKGGFTVDLSGAVAFLPGSQVDVRPVRDVGPLMGQAQQYAILKMD